MNRLFPVASEQMALRRPALFSLFGIILLAPFLLKAQSSRLDLMQSYAFPVSIVFFLLAAGRSALRMPVAVPVFALLAWCSCVFYRAHATESPLALPLLEITPANHDPLGIRARTLQRNAALVARTYNLAVPELIGKSFDSSKEAYSWLQRRGDARLLVVGSDDNWDLVFGRMNGGGACDEECSRLRSFGDLYGVKIPDEAVPVEPLFAAPPLFLVERPELIHVPSEPVELTSHSLAWLTAGLRGIGNLSGPLPGVVEDALSEASTVMGQWHSIAPVAVSTAVLGTFRLMEDNASPMQYQEAVDALYRAFRLSRKEYDPELYGMAVNNLAVARLYHDGDADDYRLSIAAFQEVSEMLNEDKQPTLAARVALMNLALLDGVSAAE